MAKLSQKKNLSSMQVIKTLQVLLQGNFTMNELVAKLNAGESEPIFNNSVISKYINTCRFCGIDIPKIHNKYFVTGLPFGLELTIDDVDLLENLQNIIKEQMTSKTAKVFDNFVENMNKYSIKKIGRVEKDSYKFTAEFFESAVNEKRKIKLMYKNRNEIVCTPVKMADNKGKTFFHVIYKNREKTIDSERISGIQVLSEKFIKNFSDQSVIFMLKGALAQKYTLRENEHTITPSPDGTITVSNRGENKDILFARLLRYDDKCEIISPKSYREEMAQLLDDALSDYGEV